MKKILKKWTALTLTLLLTVSLCDLSIFAEEDFSIAADEGILSETEGAESPDSNGAEVLLQGDPEIIIPEEEQEILLPEEEPAEEFTVLEPEENFSVPEAAAGDERTVSVTNQAELEAALEQAGTADTNTIITIEKDIEISGTANVSNQLVVPEGAAVTIRSAQDSRFCLIETVEFAYDAAGAKHGLIVNNGNLTLENIILDAGSCGRSVVVNPSAVLTLESGAVLKNGAENFNSGDGLGVYVVSAKTEAEGGRLYIRDGAEIRDNIAEGNGGANGSARGIGVYVGNYGVLEMTGGKISNNRCVGVGTSGVFASSYSQRGGGIAVSKGTLFITGGEISGNSSLSGGGGISIENSKVTIGGTAKIENNDACDPKVADHSDSIAGGIYIYDGILNIEEDASISGNRAVTSRSGRFYGCGAGIFIISGTVNMSGGTISNNTAEFTGREFSSEDEVTQHLYDAYLEGCGGGVFIQGGTFNMTGGVITGNAALSDREDSPSQGCGGGVYLGFTNGNGGTSNPENYGSFSFSGGRVENNDVSLFGEDIYVADRITTITSAIGQASSGTSTVGEVAGSPTFLISGTPSAGILYLPGSSECLLGSTTTTGEAVITLTAPLLEGAQLGIYGEKAQESQIAARPGSGYAISNRDAGYLKSLNDGYSLSLDFSGNIAYAIASETEKTDLSGADIQVADAVFTGTAVEPEISVLYAGQNLEKGTDYAVSFANNVNAGKGTATINGINSYTGTITVEFTIAPRSVEEAQFRELPDYYFTGLPVIPEVSLNYNGLELAEGTDYELSCRNNQQQGTASVQVTGTGNFTGSITKEFIILPSEGITIVADEDSLRTELEKAQGSKDNPVRLLLSGDITIDAPIVTSEKTFAELLGNGNTVTMGMKSFATLNDPSCAMLEIMGESSISLFDLTLDGDLKARNIYVAEKASFSGDNRTVLTKGAAASTLRKEFGGQFIWNDGFVRYDGIIEASRSVLRGYGGIYNAGTFELGENSLIRQVLTCFGGAIYNEAGAEFTMQGGLITDASTNAKAAFGSAITNFGSFTLQDGEISGNSGAGAAVYNKGTFLMEGGRISENKNSLGTTGVGARTHAISGGGVFLSGGSFTMKAGEISGNTAVEGGGVLITAGAFVMDGADAKISENSAYDEIASSTNESNFGNGGGVFINGGSFTMKAGEICGNEAGYSIAEGRRKSYSGYGSAIFINGGTVRLFGGRIYGNKGVESYGSSNAVYFGNAAGIYRTEDDSDYPGEVQVTASGSPAVLEICGIPVIEDDIFVKQDNVITIPEALGDVVIPVTPRLLNAGYTLARYVEAAEEEFLSLDDGGKFVSEGYSYIVNQKERSIVAGTDLSECTIAVSGAVYNGSEISPLVKITDKNGNDVTGFTKEVLTEDKISAGEKEVLIKGNGLSVTGEARQSFVITQRELTADMIELETDSLYYTGEPLEPKADVRLTRNCLADANDYIITYSNNTELGTAAVTVEAAEGGNLTGSASKTFEIVKPLPDLFAIGPDLNYTYGTGEVNLWAYTKNGGELSFASSNNSVVSVSEKGIASILKAGKAVITITAAETERYGEGVMKVNFTVDRADQTITVSAAKDGTISKVYGTAAFSLGAKTSGDARLTYQSSKTDVAEVDSTGKVTIKGVGSTNLTITAAKTAKYNSTSLKVKLTVTAGTQKITLKAASGSSLSKTYGAAAFSLGAKTSGDGKLTYQSSDKKVAAVSSAGKVTLKGYGKTVITITAAKTTLYQKAVRKLTLIVYPKKMAAVTASNSAAGKALVKWKKDSKADGYQIRYGLKSDLSDAKTKTVKKNTTLQLTLTGLTKGKTYYIQIRPYKIVDQTKNTAVFGAWSKSKKLAVKK